VVTNAAFVNSRIIHPTQAQIDAAIKMAPPQAPITTSYDMLFNSFAINLGVREIAGVDYDASYRLSTEKFGTFNFSANANNQTKYAQQVVPGTAFTSRLGTSDAPKWKAVFRTVWNKDNITLSAQANYISTFMNTTITPNQEVKAFTTLDLVGSYALPAFGPTKGSTIQIRAANVMDKEPPFYNDATGYFPALASPFGRTIDVTLRASF
jgi:iron complex outermembrane receptor protein